MADAALHRRLTDRSQLNEAVGRARRATGVERARCAVGRCDRRAESPLETISRLRLEDGGRPSPRLQTQIYDDNGNWLARSDFYWDEYGVIGEADGMEKYDGTSPQTLRLEKRRQEGLDRTGLVVVRWELRDLPTLVQRIRWAFDRGIQWGPDRRWRTR